MSDVTVQLLDGAFVFRAGMNIDADGSPRAYHPDSAPGLDYLADAGKPGKWWGIACDETGKPYVQSSTPHSDGGVDPYPGFYVSTTALSDHRFPESDPRRFVDAEHVPYVKLSYDIERRGARVGDLCAVAYAGKVCFAIAADTGARLGEGSIALASALGIPSDPRHGGLSAPAASYVVFKGTAAGWPRDFTADAAAHFSAWGGLDRLASVLSPAPLVA